MIFIATFSKNECRNAMIFISIKNIAPQYLKDTKISPDLQLISHNFSLFGRHSQCNIPRRNQHQQINQMRNIFYP